MNIDIDNDTINVIAAKVANLVMRGINPVYDKPAYTINEACAFLGIKRSYLYELLREGEMQYFKSKGGKLSYIKKGDLLKWALAHKIPAKKSK